MLGLRVQHALRPGLRSTPTRSRRKFKAGLFHIVTRLLRHARRRTSIADGAYTNKAPGGVAYRCSFRVTEASYLIERLVQNAAYELGMDPAELRRKNFIQPEQFPYTSATGFVYDSGDYERALDLALEKLGYAELREEQQAARARRASCSASGSPASPRSSAPGRASDYDILGIKMFDSAELRVHPTGKAILKLGVKTQGQGHETTFAQIVAERARHPARGHHGPGRRHRQHALRARHLRLALHADARARPPRWSRRKLREKAKKLAAHLLEVAEEDIEWDGRQLLRRGRARPAKTIQEVAFAAYTNLPEGMEAGLEGVHYYDPPNMTFPFGTYAVVVEVDRGTGEWKVLRDGRRRRLRRADQPDDRRGPDHGRPDRGLRDRGDAADHVRRGRQLHRLELHGLPDPDRLGDAEVRARTRR